MGRVLRHSQAAKLACTAVIQHASKPSSHSLPPPWPQPQTAVVHPDFLDRTIGHFYKQEEADSSSTDRGSKAASCSSGWRCWRPWRRGSKGSAASGAEAGDEKGEAAGGGESGCKQARWVPKEKAAFIQTPQDFFNVDAKDPVRAFCVRFEMDRPASCPFYRSPSLRPGASLDDFNCLVAPPPRLPGPNNHTSTLPPFCPLPPPPADGALRPIFLRTHAARPGRHRRRALLRHRWAGVPASSLRTC